MPFVHPIHDPEKDDDPRKECLTEEQLDYFSEQTRRAVKKAVRNYSRGAILGFLILLGGIGVVQITQNHENQDAQKALVQSGRVVAVDGCNRDFKYVERIRSLLGRLSDANKQAYEAGGITGEQYARAQAFYKSEMARQKLPDCRRAEQVLSDDPEKPINPPTPLYPKG